MQENEIQVRVQEEIQRLLSRDPEQVIMIAHRAIQQANARVRDAQDAVVSVKEGKNMIKKFQQYVERGSFEDDVRRQDQKMEKPVLFLVLCIVLYFLAVLIFRG